MDEKSPSAPSASPEPQSLLRRYPRFFFWIQVFNNLILGIILGLSWYWGRNPFQREAPRQTMTTIVSEEQPEIQDTTADFQVSRIPYNETTIVNIMSDIYRTYLQLNYLSDWEVSWAPEGGHPINEALCEELHIDPVVVSLMKQLPYVRFSGIAADLEFIYPYSRAYVYLEDYEIRVGRDPDFVGFDEPRTDVLLPHEIALTCSMDEGVHLILDTKENTIRVWSFSEGPPDGSDDYRSYYPHHAPTWLASYLQQLRSLDLIPGMTRYHRSLYHKAYGDEYSKMKKVLQEQYGWPYDFREAEWKTVSQVTWQRIHRDDPTYEIGREDEFEPDVFKGGKSHHDFYHWHRDHYNTDSDST